MSRQVSSSHRRSHLPDLPCYTAVFSVHPGQSNGNEKIHRGGRGVEILSLVADQQKLRGDIESCRFARIHEDESVDPRIRSQRPLRPSMRRHSVSRVRRGGPRPTLSAHRPGPLFYPHSSRARLGAGACWSPITCLALPTQRRSQRSGRRTQSPRRGSQGAMCLRQSYGRRVSSPLIASVSCLKQRGASAPNPDRTRLR